MRLVRLDLTDFRVFARAELSPDPEGTTVLTGPNGAGKTSLLEAVAYLGTQRSLRGAPREAMVRTGCEQAYVRADLVRAERPAVSPDAAGPGTASSEAGPPGEGAPVLVEAEVAAAGRSRAQVNRQPARSRRTLAEAVPVTVFTPDDLGVVQGGPARRRDLLDDALQVADPAAAAAADDVERILRQRAALLRQAGGRLTPEVAATLDVWDERLAAAGTVLAAAREALAAALQPLVADSYAALAGTAAPAPAPAGGGAAAHVGLAYQRSWPGELAAALAAARRDDLRRAASTVGPHRDELDLTIAGRPARLQASQGEQRCLALALRLGVHRLAAARLGAPPVLLLDDVFSELDPARSRALVRELPAGQALLTTAVPLPGGVSVAATVDVGALGDRGQAAGGEGSR